MQVAMAEALLKSSSFKGGSFKGGSLFTSLFTSAATNQSLNNKSMRRSQGPSIKYVTLEGEGVREDVTVCDRGEGQEHVTSRLVTKCDRGGGENWPKIA